MRKIYYLNYKVIILYIRICVTMESKRYYLFVQAMGFYELVSQIIFPQESPQEMHCR